MDINIYVTPYYFRGRSSCFSISNEMNERYMAEKLGIILVPSIVTGITMTHHLADAFEKCAEFFEADPYKEDILIVEHPYNYERIQKILLGLKSIIRASVLPEPMELECQFSIIGPQPWRGETAYISSAEKKKLQGCLF